MPGNGDFLKPPRQGDPQSISAMTFDTLLRQQRQTQNLRQPGDSPSPQGLAPLTGGQIYVQNNSGVDVDRFDVLAFGQGSGPSVPAQSVFTIADEPDQFKNNNVTKGNEGYPSSVNWVVGIAAEPIPGVSVQGVGRMYVSGVCVCKVYIQNQYDLWADISLDNSSGQSPDVTQLYSRSLPGVARIISCDKPGTLGTQWCQVLLGPSVNLNTLFQGVMCTPTAIQSGNPGGYTGTVQLPLGTDTNRPCVIFNQLEANSTQNNLPLNGTQYLGFVDPTRASIITPPGTSIVVTICVIAPAKAPADLPTDTGSLEMYNNLKAAGFIL